MDFNRKIAIITGAGHGIGAALAREFAARGARVAVADLNETAAKSVAQEIGGIAFKCDATLEGDIQALVALVEAELGPVDIFFSNAGICLGEPDHAASAPNSTWQACWDVHVMAHVYATRAVLPGMIGRGDGYLVQMASAAGVLNQIGDAAYSTTKHAAVDFQRPCLSPTAIKGSKSQLPAHNMWQHLCWAMTNPHKRVVFPAY